MEFTEGIPKWKTCKEIARNGEADGTYIWYKPSASVFKAEPIHFDFNNICKIIEDYSYCNKGIEFILTDAINNNTVTYCSKNGLLDFAAKAITNPTHPTPIYISESEDGIDVEIIAQWTKNKEKFYLFSNGGENPDGGTPITGIKMALTNFIKKQGVKFDPDFAKTGFMYICSVSLKDPVYDGQTKTKINNPELRGLCQKVMNKALDNFAFKYPKEMNSVLTYLKNYSKAEEAANKARDALLNQAEKEKAYKNTKINNPDKFKDCEKHGQDSILIISEGNSALSGLNPARDINYEALYAIRGKIINLMKHPLGECLNNQEVSDIILALGCGIQDRYNPAKLNYGKVAIASDADPDGYSIMCLVATMFYVLMPKFIEEGRLCWLRAPLYYLGKGNKRVYAYNDEELDELKKTHADWTQGRFKG